MKIFSVLAVALAFSAMAPAQTPAKNRMVVVISLDGFPAFSLEDPKLPIPTLRHLIREGALARMSIVNPTVTWPNHTAMVTGVGADRHGLLVNGTVVPTGAWPPVKVDPKIDKVKMVHSPTIYDAAFQAGLTTAQVDWVAINNAPTITWPFNEWATAEGAVEREMIRKGLVSVEDMTNFDKTNILFRDEIWTKAAAHIIREHKPNLMLYHLLSLDSVQHQYGPKTLAGTTAIAFLDSCVEKIVEAVRDAGMTARTTFIVVSDHGFKAYTKQVRPAVGFEAAGIAGSAYVLPEGGTAFVYLDKAKAAETLPKVLAAATSMEGIDQVITPEGFAALGLPLPSADPQMFDVLLTAKTGYSFSGATGGPVTAAVPQTSGSHGYLASDPDMDAIFIASGWGVKAGTKLDRIANIDVAPTLARFLGVSLPTANGKAVLDPR
jgi:predicted AlkP superfamily pyrophosphatase or phosphodiesterase